MCLGEKLRVSLELCGFLRWNLYPIDGIGENASDRLRHFELDHIANGERCYDFVHEEFL